MNQAHTYMEGHFDLDNNPFHLAGVPLRWIDSILMKKPTENINKIIIILIIISFFNILSSNIPKIFYDLI